MKKVTLLLVLMLSQFILGQEVKSYLVSYNYVNVGLNESKSVSLYIKGNESLTIFNKNDSIINKNSFDDKGDFNINISGDDKVGKRVYKNLKEKQIVFRDFYSTEGKLRPCIVEEELPIFKWVFGVKAKKIGKFLCNSAELNFRGRTFEVWYTNQIPISHGPWKFYGLTGLIMEIKSKDLNISFTINKIKESNSVSDKIQIPKEGKKILFNDYVNYKENTIKDFIKNLYSKLPRGAKIKLNSTPVSYNLEKKFKRI